MTGPHTLALSMAWAAEASRYPADPADGVAEALRAHAAALSPTGETTTTTTTMTAGGGASGVAVSAALAAAMRRNADASVATVMVPHSWVYPSAVLGGSDGAESAADLARDTVMFGHSRDRAAHSKGTGIFSTVSLSPAQLAKKRRALPNYFLLAAAQHSKVQAATAAALSLAAPAAARASSSSAEAAPPAVDPLHLHVLAKQQAVHGGRDAVHVRLLVVAQVEFESQT